MEQEQIYELLNSGPEDTKSLVNKRNIILLILANIYYWPKLLQYLAGYLEYANGLIPISEILIYSIGIPVYIAGALLIFGKPFGRRDIWKALVTIPALDEAYAIYNLWSSTDLTTLVTIVIILFPLYLMGVIYAYGSKFMWLAAK